VGSKLIKYSIFSFKNIFPNIKMLIQSASLQGIRESNEDEHVIIENIDSKDKNLNKVNMLAVYDGHGGPHVSKFLKDNMFRYFLKKTNDNKFNDNKKTINYINGVFNHLQNKLKKQKFAKYSGSTALVTLETKNRNKRNLWVANTGDCRSVMCNRYNIAIQLTKDHKPNCMEERKRIEGLNGKIVFDGDDWRVKDLSLSRAFGDLDATPYVTHLPQIYKYKISNSDKFIILACDGLWDVMSNQEVINFILEYKSKIDPLKDNINIAEKLAKFAINSGSSDNITIIINFFK
jgi:serine/threonine protein phosphatase PrpC